MHEHAGYSEPPGRAACALVLARAEQHARAEGWYVAEQYEAAEGEYVAVLCSEAGEVLGVLGGMAEAEAEAPAYWRVAAAGLAAEAMAEGERQAEAAEHEGLGGEANASRAHVTGLAPFERGVVQARAGGCPSCGARLAALTSDVTGGTAYVCAEHGAAVRGSRVKASQLRGGSAWHEGTRVLVRTELNEGRYMGREATVVRVYPVGEAGGVHQQHKVCVQLRTWNGLREAHDGRLYLNLEEVELA